MPTYESISVTVCVRDDKFEPRIRQCFSNTMPGAKVEFVVGEPSAFADIIEVTGEMDAPTKPFVIAQEVIGDFNCAIREANQTTPEERAST